MLGGCKTVLLHYRKKVLIAIAIPITITRMPKLDLLVLSRSACETARRASSLSVSELAQRAGVCTKTLWLARNEKPIGLPSAKKIARALRVSLASLRADVASPKARGAEQTQDDGPAVSLVSDAVPVCESSITSEEQE